MARSDSDKDSPPDLAKLFAIALELHGKGNLIAAEKAYRGILERDPGHANGWNNLAVLLKESGRLEEALACFERLAGLEPRRARAQCGRGVVLRAQGNNAEAANAYRQAIAIEPSFIPAYSNLGNLLYALRAFSEGANCFAQVLSMAADDIDARFMLAKSQLAQGLLDSAEAALERVLQQNPAHIEAWGTLGQLWSERHCLPEALHCLDQAITIRPDHSGLHYNRALLRLLAGDLAGGFADYEHRFDVPDFPSRRLDTNKPTWHGQTLPNAAILVYAEQGLGDTLQFLRFVPIAANRVRQLWLLIDEKLGDLPALPDNVQLLPNGSKMPDVVAICPLVSLAHLLTINPRALSSSIPYLRCHYPQSSHWKNRVSGEGMRIGLVWAGNPAHSNDSNRSLPLAQLAPLLRHKRIHWYSLQVGARREDLASSGLSQQICDLGGDLADFSDTAAALQQLDLLICVDTSIAHLAGALGLPVWLMLPHMPDWRWQLHRSDSPWYPSIRIFRQAETGSWSSVIAALDAELLLYSQPESMPAQQRSISVTNQLEEGRLLLEANQIDLARRFFWRALVQSPWDGRSANALAVSFYRQNRPEQAAHFGMRACRLTPTNPETWSNYGAYLKTADDLEAALQAFDEGLAIHPAYPGLLYNRGLAKLLSGKLAEGFADYEYRFDVPDFPSQRLQTDKPVWRGELISEQVLLLHAEQGLGDTMQFVRYLPLVASLAKRVILIIQKPLVDVVNLPAAVELHDTTKPLPDFDICCPLLSLPHLCGTTAESISDDTPYLRTDVKRASTWLSQPDATRLQVGIVWAGSATHKNDINRSIAFDELSPLWNVPGIKWHSLQVGPANKALTSTPGLNIIDLGKNLHDFSDTAAALEQLDLLICVDTSIAHLAGGLGLPVWLLLPHIPDWRWQMKRADSPWYPTMRIFRQHKAGDWTSVLLDVVQELSAVSQPDTSEGQRLLSHASKLQEQGGQLLATSRFAEAKRHYQHALSMQPGMAAFANALAVCTYRLGQDDAAALYGLRACRQTPGDAEIWSNCGAYLKNCKALELALVCQLRAQELAPSSPAVRSNMANLLGVLGRWPEALALTTQLVSDYPNNPDYRFSHGISLKENARFTEAMDEFRHAQRLAGYHVKAQLHQALLELLTGNLQEGWEHYESRWQQPDCKQQRSFVQPLWQGEDLSTRCILVHAEQGFGDSFQFLRYVPLLCQQARQVILVIQPELESFARRLHPALVLIPSGAPLPEFDCHCPLLSLPRAFKTRLDNIPADLPYLSVAIAYREKWQALLPRQHKYRIGLVWAGRPTHANDVNRSMSLQQLESLICDIPADWVILQKGSPLAQLGDWAYAGKVFAPGDNLVDFDDTAAIISELDELVSVDTSVAHLAGALGKPVRLLLPWIPDWRWLWQRTDSPWYPQFKLYRQAVRGDWEEPLARLHHDLTLAVEAAEKGKQNG
ncbi:tetratricopeptide repeat protein [Chitinilyticum piscinae]|uniref:Tetratricopeptide repeat protein n=1 Tax=Chitinilyticum piscinae TaxID=2866724 RepID=A0A8J7FFF8_9NEIS|nr:tetratricopeptide repeat protein [Chitinilyticum piscinae]MBE9608005.1 tetratricopeptide repeat protein [Chitinilyticum piscinae]